MRFRHEITYDAGCAEVYRMLADPAFREASAAAQNCVSAEAEITDMGPGMEVVVEQVQRTAGLPAFATKFVQPTTRVTQRESWSDERHATLDIVTHGVPATISGTITLSEEDGCRETIDLEVRVKIPLLGGKLESLVADLVRAGIDAEHEAGIAWLAGAS